MLTEIFKYSASFAKVKSMTGKLLKADDYEALLSKNTVNGVAAYLKNNTHYSRVLSNVSESKIHRGEFEQILQKVKVEEFTKLFKAERGKNKKFLLVFVLRYEIELLKEMLTMCESGTLFTFDAAVSEYYKKHMTIDIEQLAQSKSTMQFLELLKGSRYYKILTPFITNKGNINIFNIEMVLDIYCFSTVWKLIGTMLDKKDKQLVEKTFGSEIDILNIMWIYRFKKYFNTPVEIIYSFIIPNGYKLNREQLVTMVEAKDTEQLAELLEKTPYADIFKKSNYFMERFYYEYTIKAQRKAARLMPFSIMPMLAYIHEKDNEIRNLVKIIEGIRYKLDMKEIRRYLIRKHGDTQIGS